jgi:hypothetical protein
MREFDYSMSRVTTVGSATGSGGSLGKGVLTTEVIMKQDNSGVWYAVANTNSQKSSALPTLEVYEKFEIEQVTVPTWAMLGFAWLAATEEAVSGSVTIRPTPAAATAAMPNPTVVGQKSVVINAQAAVGVGVMKAPAEAHDPDVVVLALPFEATARMTGYGKTIAVAPFEGSGEMVDNFDLINAAGEQVVVYLHYVDAEVYLKEEAR